MKDSKLLKTIKEKSVRREIVETFKVSETTYKVVDYKSIFPFYKERRNLMFKGDDGRIYIHSSIYLNKKYCIQPIIAIAQEAAEAWGEAFEIKNALVLGCAGCSFPRFLALRFPNIQKITGIELLSEFVEIAKKYFFIDQIKDKFELLQGDAFKYVQNIPSEKQNMILVDVFSSSQVPEKIYTDKFLHELYECTDETSIVIFNFLDKEVADIVSFAKGIVEPFDEKYVLSKGGRCFLLLTKIGNKEKLQQFEEKIEQKANVVKC